MLPRVSRTFAPTIRMLPKHLNTPVTAAYLLCRIADTVEDSDALSINQKELMLQTFAQIFQEQNPEAVESFIKMVPALPKESADDELVYNLPIVLSVFNSFSERVQKHIGKWVIEMSLGMRKYAQSSKRRRFAFLNTMKELDEYTYYVAGTVGYLLTELFSYYSKKITPAIKNKMEQKLSLYIQFDDDKPIFIQESPKGVTQLQLPPLELPDSNSPMQTNRPDIAFTDGKKKFKIFVK